MRYAFLDMQIQMHLHLTMATRFELVSLVASLLPSLTTTITFL
jgi:hypothetical protein